MGWITNLFGSDGDMRQNMRNRDPHTDLNTGRCAFVNSENSGTSLITDPSVQLHQLMKNGSLFTPADGTIPAISANL